MYKYLFFIACSFSCFFTALSANETIDVTVKVDPNQYKHYIHSMDLFPTEDGGCVLTLELSDGTKWKNITTITEDKLLYNFQKSMARGVEVLISPHTLKSDYYDFQPAGDKHIFTLAIEKETYAIAETMPSIVKKDRVKVKNGNYFKPSTYEHTLYLSDNSIWKSNKNSPFSEGDHLLISRSGTDKWYLINVFGKVKFPHDTRYTDDYQLVNATIQEEEVNETSEKVKDTIDETSDKVRDSANKTSEKVKDTVNETSEKVKDSINETSEKIKDSVNETSEKKE